MDDLPEPIKDLAEEIGGKAGSTRWEVFTAVFGWGAAFCLLGMLAASMLGLGKVTFYATVGFSTLFGIAFKRDLKKLVSNASWTK